jgi:hypothetical protein
VGTKRKKMMSWMRILRKSRISFRRKFVLFAYKAPTPAGCCGEGLSCLNTKDASRGKF